MSKQIYEVREDKTMDWEKRLRYSVNCAKQLWPLECRGKETIGLEKRTTCVLSTRSTVNRAMRRLAQSSRFSSHPLTQVCQRGRFFESPEMKGISVRFWRSGLPLL